MRVVAGLAGGRRLRGPGNVALRPTTDKVREAVFNSLQSLGVVEQARVLDLFAGTGACGIEALSRGAQSATFVDQDRKALQIVQENLTATDLKGEVVKSDALAFLAQGRQFDVVFADPPYVFDQWQKLIEAVETETEAEILVCESDRSIEAGEKWESIRERRYGDTMVMIFRRKQ